MESNRDITRENIIKAASIAFSKFGYKKTTLEDIAVFTNVSKTGLYYYFKNKEEVFNEVIKKEAERLQETLIKAIKQEKKPLDKFSTYIKTRMEFLAQISNYYSALRYDLMEHLSTINKNRTEFNKIELNILENIFEEGNKSGAFAISDIKSTANLTLLILISLELPLFGTDNSYNYQETLDQLTSLCLHGIIPR